ncbi:hypothetical protein [Flavobacterium sp.]|uniref:hypothetical protein n=1 Tax=Flavobacterium sp. TaxID=239 RepID=UPI000ECB481B|nr:hypothetical protein [Flavobacterium sp.]HCQ14350.1 hypothetical protein [Flavobacterium sp.]
MNEKKIALLKIFSIILKDRAKTEIQYQNISPEMLKFFSRKELIEIITHNCDGQFPQDYNLAEMENEELLQLIGDDFSIISYVMSKWSKEAAILPSKQEWFNSKFHSDSNTETTDNPLVPTKSETIEMDIDNSEQKNQEVVLDSKTASKKGIPEKTK